MCETTGLIQLSAGANIRVSHSIVIVIAAYSIIPPCLSSITSTTILGFSIYTNQTRPPPDKISFNDLHIHQDRGIYTSVSPRCARVPNERARPRHRNGAAGLLPSARPQIGPLRHVVGETHAAAAARSSAVHFPLIPRQSNVELPRRDLSIVDANARYVTSGRKASLRGTLRPKLWW
jgi:hypothetical protein